MNVRLATDDIRFRLSVDELQALMNGRTLVETVALPEATIDLRLSPAAPGEPTRVETRRFGLQATVAQADLAALAAAGRSKQGVEHRLGPVRLAIEVDIRSHA